MLNEKFVQKLDEEAIQKLDAAQSEEEFCAILAENGLTAEEIERFVEYLKNSPEELSEDDLEDVAGGGPSLQRYIYKWAYRITHGKWFVKTTYDSNNRTITATNRFGEKVSETYLY